MTEPEFVICHLRSQVRDLQALLSDLESLDAVDREDYGFVRAKLHEVIRHLKKTARLSSERSEATQPYDAHWLN
jgi:hypothetical protein